MSYSNKILLAVFLASLQLGAYAQIDSLFLENLLCGDTSKIVQKVMANPGHYRLQIMYTHMELDKWNCPKAIHHSYRLRPSEYFYPASLVKLPAALMALEWLDQNRLTKEATLLTKASYLCNTKTKRTSDSTSIAQFIEKSMVVSDNSAFNEIYEMLGVNYMNATLGRKGYPSAKIFQRLDNCDYASNLKNDTVYIKNQHGDTIYFRGQEKSSKGYETENAIVGTKFFTNGTYLETGKNFRHCNQLSLWDLHKMLVSIFYPESTTKEQAFCLSDRDRKFLITSLGKLPNELDSIKYSKRDSTQNMDFKYLLAGGSGKNFPTNIRIYNKVGLSYGFMEDIAYVVDTKTKTGFFISCVLFANEDGIMNDGKYEYQTLGFPFMKRLGKILLDHHQSQSIDLHPPLPSFEEESIKP